MDPELAWQDLVAAALLGTERRAYAPPSTTGPLGALLAELAGRDAEKALLGAAAALAPFRRAGRRPASDASPPVDSADDDDRARCSAASDGHLALMLAGAHAEVLPEWLAALAEADKRPPEEALPDLLDLGRSRPDLRPAIVAAIGPFGAWLARQNPEWDYASGSDSTVVEDDEAVEALWETGTAGQRTSLLGRLRESRPDRARALVASTWSSDGPDVRARFLGEFSAALSPADEPFLEAALDDRRKEVRTAAAGLLARLPDSGLVRRMIERVTPLLELADRPPLVVEAILPKACEKAMTRDGIEPKPARSGLGEKAWWFWQMIARIPPSHWSRAWARTPAELVEAVARSQWFDALYPGLVEAATLHRDGEWLDALLPLHAQAPKTFNIFAHFATLPEATTHKLILAKDVSTRTRLADRPLTEDEMNLLHRTPGPWGDELSRLVLGRMARNLGHKGHFHHALVGLLSAAARCLPTAAVLASPPGRTVADSEVQGYVLNQVDRQLEAFHALIQFRHDMVQELRR